MYATSYHPEALGGDDVTAIGMTLRKGIIASNPNVIRYRTQVYVPDDGDHAVGMGWGHAHRRLPR
jgi:3D (Asp-Asp-Asp) domain-containing protein